MDPGIQTVAASREEVERWECNFEWIGNIRGADLRNSGALVAAKSDISEYGEVKAEEGSHLAQQHGLGFFTCSAVRLQSAVVELSKRN